MKTIEETAWLIEEFVEFKSHDKINDQKRLLNILRLFEKGIRRDQKQKDIDTLSRIPNVFAICKDDAITAIQEGE